MKRITIVTRIVLATAALAPLAGTPLMAQPAARPAAGHYSVSATLVGTLLDDPAAADILKRMIPTVYANDMFQQNGRSLTLQDIQQYEPDALSNANLARIQAEFDKLPAKGS